MTLFFKEHGPMPEKLVQVQHEVNASSTNEALRSRMEALTEDRGDQPLGNEQIAKALATLKEYGLTVHRTADPGLAKDIIEILQTPDEEEPFTMDDGQGPITIPLSLLRLFVISLRLSINIYLYTTRAKTWSLCSAGAKATVGILHLAITRHSLSEYRPIVTTHLDPNPRPPRLGTFSHQHSIPIGQTTTGLALPIFRTIARKRAAYTTRRNIDPSAAKRVFEQET